MLAQQSWQAVHVFTGVRKMNRKSHLMTKDTVNDQCSDPTRELSLKIPCRLVKRGEAYATETGADITNVVIEALDVFLRGRK
jgi:hypothetical protein